MDHPGIPGLGVPKKEPGAITREDHRVVTKRWSAGVLNGFLSLLKMFGDKDRDYGKG